MGTLLNINSTTGAIDKCGGITLPTSQIGATPTPLSTYEETILINFSMGNVYASPGTLPCYFTRCGNQVTLTWDTMSGSRTVVTGAYFLSSAPIPSRFLPKFLGSNFYAQTVPVIDGASPISYDTAGLFSIEPTGLININSAVNSTQNGFFTGAYAGIVSSSITYICQ